MRTLAVVGGVTLFFGPFLGGMGYVIWAEGGWKAVAWVLGGAVVLTLWVVGAAGLIAWGLTA